MLELDKYQVRAVVRNIENKQKMDTLKKAFGAHHFHKIEFVREEDLVNEEALTAAFEGASSVIHTSDSLRLD